MRYILLLSIALISPFNFADYHTGGGGGSGGGSSDTSYGGSSGGGYGGGGGSAVAGLLLLGGLIYYLNRDTDETEEDDANAFIYLSAYSKMVASISGINYTSPKGDSNSSEKIITALNFLEDKIELSADLISDEKNKIVLFKDKPLNSTFFDYLTYKSLRI